VESAQFLTGEEREYARKSVTIFSPCAHLCKCCVTKVRRLKADCELPSIVNDGHIPDKVIHIQKLIPNCEYLMSEEEVFEWGELWRGRFLDTEL
jgi:hypothetical protein